MTDQGVPIVNLPFKYISGLDYVFATDLTFSLNSGQCRDSTNTYDLVLNNPVTVSISYVGLNGLDTGVVVRDKVYYLYLISDPVNANPTGAILSLSNSAPLMPFGYSAYRLIGMVLSAFSAGDVVLYNFACTGTSNLKQFRLDSTIAVLVAGNATTPTTIGDLAPYVPVLNTQISAAIVCYFEIALSASTDPSQLSIYDHPSSNSIQQFAPGVTSGALSFYKVTGGVEVYPVSGVPTALYTVTAGGDRSYMYYEGCDMWL